MATGSDFTFYGEELERRLQLRTSPIAIKLIQQKEEIPKGAVRPVKDLGYHLALCQGFAMSRRNKTTVAMLKEWGDHCIDFHGPHDHQMLLASESHLHILDLWPPVRGIGGHFQYSPIEGKMNQDQLEHRL